MSITPIAPEVPETLSPYWLRLYGKWIHLEGIQPVVDTSPNRAFSDLVTVDGYRFVQRAPRGPRSWALAYDHATAAATAALESAAYDFNFNDPLTRTLFLDTNAARVNMVDPELVRKWQHPAIAAPFYTINVGESPDDPVWQPSYVATAEDVGIAGIVYIPVRAGVTYTAAFWTVHPNVFDDALKIEVNNAEVASAPNIPGGTEANPQLITLTWTPANDAVAAVEINIQSMAYSTGLMFYEGDCPPNYYLAGRRMPCQVSVQDPTLTSNLIWPSANCDPCALPRESTSFNVLEVGAGAGAAAVV
jgi:hypothetical protein